MYSIAYNPIALEEYEQSIEWYAARSIKASENFIIDVQESIEEIKRNPTQFKSRYKKFYETTLKKYPFDIIYIIEKERIVILSIYHQKRNPKKKYRK